MLVAFSGGGLLACVALVTIISIIIGMSSSTIGTQVVLSLVAAPAPIKPGASMMLLRRTAATLGSGRQP